MKFESVNGLTVTRLKSFGEGRNGVSAANSLCGIAVADRTRFNAGIDAVLSP